MARKKNVETTETNGPPTAVAEMPMALPMVGDTPTEPPVTEEKAVRKPEVSWRCPVDRNTSIEVAVWCQEMTSNDGQEKWTQRNITVVRSYRDQQNVWCKGGSYRAHDVPVLLFLLGKAHAYCLDARTSDSTVPF